MRRYTTTGTYSGRRSYTPGIMQYSSPTPPVVNPFGARSEQAQCHNRSSVQRQSTRNQHRS
ncbi:hypothetical protein IC229_01630 [Spirosoma sp. BT702]|uniref:Uncharacterized protein n=1 Tax=Spirosoma profusum TaxID=2771354 RepID=A0A926XX44_9BACT|nr:hypothetical protein [Spirosoma profusum]MBD2699318.1 hypothetical protein [Spirosoma profusum]